MGGCPCKIWSILLAGFWYQKQHYWASAVRTSTVTVQNPYCIFNFSIYIIGYAYALPLFFLSTSSAACDSCGKFAHIMMTSSNGNIFRVTGHLCGEFTSPRWIPQTQRPVTLSFDVFFDLRLNKWLSKQWWGWWFETPPRPFLRHCNDSLGSVHSYWLISLFTSTSMIKSFDN